MGQHRDQKGTSTRLYSELHRPQAYLKSHSGSSHLIDLGLVTYLDVLPASVWTRRSSRVAAGLMKSKTLTAL